jgi:hypothetical protein
MRWLYWIRTFKSNEDFEGHEDRFQTIEELEDAIKKVNNLLYEGKIVDFEVCDY